LIYDEPKFLPGGDRYIEMELGDELNFDLNFLVHALSARIREAGIAGLIELLPNMASIVLGYDPDAISFTDLKSEILGHYRTMGSLEEMELLSPVYYIPVLYCDPVTRACWEDYCAKIGEKEYDPDVMVRLNNLDDYADLARRHSGTEYWVSALGFYPGLASLIALDPRCRMTAPKYNPPRTWTPKGTIGYGGSVTCVYPANTPGGYQIIGHTPVPVCDMEQRLPAFKDDLALLRPGDRVRFLPVGPDEYAYVESRVTAGDYVHNVAHYAKFSIRAYHEWLASIDMEARI
jgi:KipI family sensor histidine kinase inhibitor